MDLHKPEVSAALDTLHRMYYDEVREYVEDFKSRRGEWFNADEMREAIEQELDGSECVIYTYKARLVAALSDSFGDAMSEIEDMGMSSESITPELIAFLCMKLDVFDRLDFDELFAEKDVPTDAD